MEQKLALLAAGDSVELKGFKFAGVMPLRLKYITVRTHVRMCAIKAKIKQLKPDGEGAMVSDLDNAELQEAFEPLIIEYLLIGLLNNRRFGCLMRPFLKAKLQGCGYVHLVNIYDQLAVLASPMDFYRLWIQATTTDSTLLRAGKPSKGS